MSSEWFSIDVKEYTLTEMVKNMGVKNVRVMEVIDLQKLDSAKKVYGLFFYYQYIPNDDKTQKVLKEWDSRLYFSKQMIVNSCPTHSVISILLNSNGIELGPTLFDLKISQEKETDPYTKGLAMANCKKLIEENNKLSQSQNYINNNKLEVYHSVCFVYVNQCIYELDGMKEGPIALKDNVNEENWVREIKEILSEKISLFITNDIEFNLFEVIPDRNDKIKNKEEDAFDSKMNIEELLLREGDVNVNVNSEKFQKYNFMSREDFVNGLMGLNRKSYDNRIIGLKDEEDKINKLKDNDEEKRQCDYTSLIFEILKIMNERGIIEEVYSNLSK